MNKVLASVSMTFGGLKVSCEPMHKELAETVAAAVIRTVLEEGATLDGILERVHDENFVGGGECNR